MKITRWQSSQLDALRTILEQERCADLIIKKVRIYMYVYVRRSRSWIRYQTTTKSE